MAPCYLKEVVLEVTTYILENLQLLEHSEMFARVEQTFPLCSIFIQLYSTFTHFSLHHKIVSSFGLGGFTTNIYNIIPISLTVLQMFVCLWAGSEKVCEKTRQAGTQIWLCTRVSIWSFYQTKKDKFICIFIQLEYPWFCKMQSVIISPPAVSL